MAKSADAFRTIAEVAEWLDTPAHVLRFWESKFNQIRPVKRAGGRRYYRPEDMALLGGIKTLLHEEGLSVKGAQKLLRERGVRYVSGLSPPIDGEPPLRDVSPAEEISAPLAPVAVPPKALDIPAFRPFGGAGRAEPMAPSATPAGPVSHPPIGRPATGSGDLPSFLTGKSGIGAAQHRPDPPLTAPTPKSAETADEPVAPEPDPTPPVATEAAAPPPSALPDASVPTAKAPETAPVPGAVSPEALHPAPYAPAAEPASSPADDTPSPAEAEAPASDEAAPVPAPPANDTAPPAEAEASASDEAHHAARPTDSAPAPDRPAEPAHLPPALPPIAAPPEAADLMPRSERPEPEPEPAPQPLPPARRAAVTRDGPGLLALLAHRDRLARAPEKLPPVIDRLTALAARLAEDRPGPGG